MLSEVLDDLESDGICQGPEIYDDPSELYHDAHQQLAKQLKNKIVISGDYVKAILPGKYSAKSGDVRIELDVHRRISTNIESRNYLKVNARDAKGDQYTKPNLPKESMSEADDEGKPHSQFQARIETITENGKEVKTIPITKHLAEWLSQIEAKEGYDDIIDRLLKGSEVPVNLNEPIKRVLVSLVK